MAKAKTAKPPPLPAFRNDAEERKFWKTHSPAEYLAQCAQFVLT